MQENEPPVVTPAVTPAIDWLPSAVVTLQAEAIKIPGSRPLLNPSFQLHQSHRIFFLILYRGSRVLANLQLRLFCVPLPVVSHRLQITSAVSMSNAGCNH